MIDEGYVKFDCNWELGPALEGIEDLVRARNKLHEIGLVGIYLENGIGFGNVSKRIGTGKEFIISGTATGGIVKADARHFCRVTDWDVAKNAVRCSGPVAASSESMTHAMLYHCDPSIGAILHVHHRAFWEWLLENVPYTRAEVAYGTPAMAMEMARLLAESDLRSCKVLAMKGHEEGIIAFGSDLQEAMNVLIRKMKEWQT